MARRKLTAKVCRAKYRGAKLRACLLTVGARKEASEHPWSGKLARRIARDHLRENPRAYGADASTEPQWRIRKRPIGGWWAEFLPPGRKRWIVMPGVPFRTKEDAEFAVEDHKSRLLER